MLTVLLVDVGEFGEFIHLLLLLLDEPVYVLTVEEELDQVGVHLLTVVPDFSEVGEDAQTEVVVEEEEATLESVVVVEALLDLLFALLVGLVHFGEVVVVLAP